MDNRIEYMMKSGDFILRQDWLPWRAISTARLMSNLDSGWIASIAISISESPDLPRLGMSGRHLTRAMETMATCLLSSGYRLAYGGDLRQGGFTEQLFELVSRYDRSPESRGLPAVVDYLPWPACAALSLDKYRDLSMRLGNSAEVKCQAHDGTVLEDFEFPETPVTNQGQITESLTAMRRTMLKETSARVVLGGRVKDYTGSIPGIAEEALLTLQAGKPLYVAGGFGGCARDIAETMELVKPLHDPPRSAWDGHAAFSAYRVDALNNGLTDDENRTLAKTPHIRQAVGLILRGLDRCSATIRMRTERRSK